MLANQIEGSSERMWRAPLRRIGAWVLMVGLLWSAISCGSIPRRYLAQAETGVTLMDLQRAPEQYQGKLVILGGVIVDEQTKDGRRWLRMKNRPLDDNYRPHLSDPEGPENGYYWVAVDAEKIPAHYREWAQLTVVGQVVPKRPGVKSDPVLAAVYLRGWSRMSGEHSVWEIDDPNYSMDAPAGLHGEFSPH